MDFIGGFMLVEAFFAKNFDVLFMESFSRVDYNPFSFRAKADQKAAGITGFAVILTGFVQEAFVYLPWTIPSFLFRFAQLGTVLAADLTWVFLMFIVRQNIVDYYVGLLSLTWTYGNTAEVPVPYLRRYLKGIKDFGIVRSRRVERASWGNFRLSWAIVKLGRLSADEWHRR